MLKRLLFISFFILMFSFEAKGFDETDIGVLENSRYGRVYSDESLAQRLNRLENDVLGLNQSGDLDSRVERLMMLNSNNMSIPVYSQAIPEKKKGFFKQISDYFTDTGALTGFIPGYTSGYSNGYSYSGFGNTGFNNIFGGNNSYCNYYGDNNFRHYRRFGHKYGNNFREPRRGYNRQIPRGYEQRYNPIYAPPSNVAASSTVRILND